MNDDGRIVSVEKREGLLLYSDSAGHEGLRVVAHLSVTMAAPAEGQIPAPVPGAGQVVWVTHGPFGAIVEALANYYLHSPGVKDAVDGMFVSLAKKRANVV